MSVDGLAGWRKPVWMVASAALLALTGCPNPEQAYDEFSDRFDAINGGTGGSGTGGSGGGAACTAPAETIADGQYMFALSASLNPQKAFALDATMTTHAAADGLTVDLVLQPLSYMDQATPVGDPLSFTALPVNADGSFEWDLGEVTLVKDANAINPANDVVSTLQLKGELCAETPDFICGSVSGIVSKPLTNFDLSKGKGSKFTMQKYEGTAPAPVIDCAKTPAAY